MFSFVPDAERLSQIFSQAIAPTFFLGAVAAFVSLMASRLSAVVARLQTLNAITDDEHLRTHLKADIEHRRSDLPSGNAATCLRKPRLSTVRRWAMVRLKPWPTAHIGPQKPPRILLGGDLAPNPKPFESHRDYLRHSGGLSARPHQM